MIQDNDFRTATMARVYSSQGHYEKAAQIYKHLLKREPDRQDLSRELTGVEKKLHEKTKGSNDDLGDLFNTWVDLILRCKRMQYLRKIKGKLNK